MAFTTWHYEIDTLPHLERTEIENPQAFDICIPIGVWSEPQQSFNIILEIWVNEDPSFRIGFDITNPKGLVRGITRDAIAALRVKDRKAARWYLDMEEKISQNQYYEAIIKNVPEGVRVRYNIKVFPLNQASLKLGPYTIHTVTPNFSYDDIFSISDGGSTIDNAFALYYKEDDKNHYIRVDFVEITTSHLNFQLEVNNQLYSLSAIPFLPDQLPSLPLINPFEDYVTITIPKTVIGSINRFKWQGNEYDVHQKKGFGQARVMFIHYCMQGLNDLFELPDKSYNPPRTFIQVTMRDELARYSSRPNSEEGQEGDGYLYTIDAHRKYNIPYLWTFNGGVLGLIAHDCPDDLQQIKLDITNRVMEPTIAGFGGHRLPYYQEETNLYSIQYGIKMLQNILGECNTVYYLDQRLFKQLPNLINALKKSNVQYIVVDGSTGFLPYKDTIQPNANGQGAYLDDHYVWQDRSSGLYLFYIIDDMREKMFGSSDREMVRGKLALDLKRKFFYFAANPIVRRNHLMIYSDDADKASGNGWFDGKYAGSEILFKEKFDSALEWIANHPWIAAITSAELDPQRDCVGTIDMKTAICPAVDPGGSLTTDLYGKQIHFDQWYDNWKNFHSYWLNQSLEEISQSTEFAITDWPQQYRNRIYDLGQMNFSMYLHESQWNKQPLEPIDDKDSNQRLDVVEPEDFVISASLQLRNAQVYLNASVWAEWALRSTDNSTYLNNGEVIDLLRNIHYQDYIWRDDRYKNKPILDNPLYWDRDVMHNVILYNREALIVMDQNGGRITHLFSIYKGKPYCISGTFKCYQFLTGEKISGENVSSDGEVIQNTVFTPNHSYIACDVHQARGVIGKKYNPKTKVERELDCYYPDNFNAYRYKFVDEKTVEWIYDQSSPMPALNLKQFRLLLEQDHEAKLRGENGIVFHQFPKFLKQISLNNRTIEIRYFGVQKGHVVANEFCVDLNDSIMLAKRQNSNIVDQNTIDILNKDGVSVRLELLSNCMFTEETLFREPSSREPSKRLHRVMTDCLELTTQNGGDFSYRIQI